MAKSSLEGENTEKTAVEKYANVYSSGKFCNGYCIENNIKYEGIMDKTGNILYSYSVDEDGMNPSDGFILNRSEFVGDTTFYNKDDVYHIIKVDGTEVCSGSELGFTSVWGGGDFYLAAKKTEGFDEVATTFGVLNPDGTWYKENLDIKLPKEEIDTPNSWEGYYLGKNKWLLHGKYGASAVVDAVTGKSIVFTNEISVSDESDAPRWSDGCVLFSKEDSSTIIKIDEEMKKVEEMNFPENYNDKTIGIYSSGLIYYCDKFYDKTGKEVIDMTDYKIVLMGDVGGGVPYFDGDYALIAAKGADENTYEMYINKKGKKVTELVNYSEEGMESPKRYGNKVLFAKDNMWHLLDLATNEDTVLNLSLLDYDFGCVFEDVIAFQREYSKNQYGIYTDYKGEIFFGSKEDIYGGEKWYASK